MAGSWLHFADLTRTSPGTRATVATTRIAVAAGAHCRAYRSARLRAFLTKFGRIYARRADPYAPKAGGGPGGRACAGGYAEVAHENQSRHPHTGPPDGMSQRQAWPVGEVVVTGCVQQVQICPPSRGETPNIVPSQSFGTT
jgi:hypothetical protein